MSRTLRLRSIAEEEIASIALWYEFERVGLGSRFLDEAQNVFVNLRQFPFMYQTILPEIHRAPLNNFPYAIFYTVNEEEIIILGCRHMHQNPVSWPAV